MNQQITRATLHRATLRNAGGYTTLAVPHQSSHHAHHAQRWWETQGKAAVRKPYRRVLLKIAVAVINTVGLFGWVFLLLAVLTAGFKFY